MGNIIGKLMSEYDWLYYMGNKLRHRIGGFNMFSIRILSWMAAFKKVRQKNDICQELNVDFFG